MISVGQIVSFEEFFYFHLATQKITIILFVVWLYKVGGNSNEKKVYFGKLWGYKALAPRQ